MYPRSASSIVLKVLYAYAGSFAPGPVWSYSFSMANFICACEAADGFGSYPNLACVAAKAVSSVTCGLKTNFTIEIENNIIYWKTLSTYLLTMWISLNQRSK